MAIFVLVHGAWHGGWVWHKVAPLLMQKQHQVFCPTLKGLADRSQELSPRITLQDHIDDICSLICDNNLPAVVLVGHSYAGMVITGVADRMPDKISQLIYIDAVIPTPGQSMLQIYGVTIAREYQNRKSLNKASYFVPAKSALEFGLETKEDIDFASSKYSPQPIKTFAHPINFDPVKLATISKTYIHCRISHFDELNTKTLQNMALRAKTEGWQYFELNTGHSCMLTMPGQLVEILTIKG